MEALQFMFLENFDVAKVMSIVLFSGNYFCLKFSCFNLMRNAAKITLDGILFESIWRNGGCVCV